MKEMEVKMLSGTQQPVVTAIKIWKASKGEDFTDVTEEESKELWPQLVLQDVPVLENLHYQFLFQNVPVSWREQAVRHRIGVKAGENYGIDIIPDFPGSSWWSQSMRIKNVGGFYHRGDFYIPESIRGNKELQDVYTHVLESIGNAYTTLVNFGIPMEDARNLIPLGATHDISWDLSHKAMLYIVNKRSCWILQAGLWVPIIKEMMLSLLNFYGSEQLLYGMGKPPCYDPKEGKIADCIFNLENERRWSGKDNLPPCPIWVYLACYKIKYGNSIEMAHRCYPETPPEGSDIKTFVKDFKRRLSLYSEIWGGEITDILL